ncbi:hypothetical protein WCQ02_39320 [Paraburkholderia tropica]|uniref:hypothetical protein n=1 Tax=Paraburkholderia tropica TaxID=92647 RepID=UPI0011B7DF79|nr:hypothetical protein [Paraburkholderia tropica]
MASFTYTVWSDCDKASVLKSMTGVFSNIGYSLRNESTGKLHAWLEPGELSLFDVGKFSIEDGPHEQIGIQWWSGDNDIYVTFSSEPSVGGTTCYVTLVGLPRSEEAEIARLLILNIIPDKRRFPVDWPVFKLSAD